MSRPIHALFNLGPRSAAMLAEIGIADEDALRAVGAVEAWRRLKFRFGRRITVVFLYALEAALLGCDWRALDPEARNRLKDRARRLD